MPRATAEKQLDPIFVTPKQASELLELHIDDIYRLVAAGDLGVKKYIGKQTKRYRLYYRNVVAYADSLPEAPVHR